MLLIYRVMHIPGFAEGLRRLRAALAAQGLGAVHVAGGWVNFGEAEPAVPEDPAALGLDALFEFPPHNMPGAQMTSVVEGLEAGFGGYLIDYDDAVALRLAAAAPVGWRHRGVMLGFDNTPRRGLNAAAYVGATPAKFRRWLRTVLRAEAARPGPPERLVFLNGWNEWGEGCALEPDARWGRGWLEAVASARALPLGAANRPLVLDGGPVSGRYRE